MKEEIKFYTFVEGAWSVKGDFASEEVVAGVVDGAVELESFYVVDGIEYFKVKGESADTSIIKKIGSDLKDIYYFDSLKALENNELDIIDEMVFDGHDEKELRKELSDLIGTLKFFYFLFLYSG
jgi:hypothetical protein